MARVSKVLLQKTSMEQSKADPCVIRKVVDEGVTLAVTAKDKETFDAFQAQLKEEFPVNDMGFCLGTLGALSSVTR